MVFWTSSATFSMEIVLIPSNHFGELLKTTSNQVWVLVVEGELLPVYRRK